MINDLLSYERRYLRTRTGKLLFGPVGKRLFVDYLDRLPGFVGRIDFIHKLNITALFEVKCDKPIQWETATTCWYPNMLTMDLQNNSMTFSEVKLIAKNDCAVSCQTWHNKGSTPMTLTLHTKAELCESSFDKQMGCYIVRTPMTVHGFSCGFAVKSDILTDSPLVIQPGEKVSFTVCAAVGNLATEEMAEIIEKATSFFCKDSGSDSGQFYVKRHNDEYEEFFKNAPSFKAGFFILQKLPNTSAACRSALLEHRLAVQGCGRF